MSTETYRGLDGHTQEQLRQIHNDHFYERQNDLWRDHAMKTLPALINASDMLVCGEDLGLSSSKPLKCHGCVGSGMIPACVHPVMQELGLIGMRIQRMPTEGEFGNPMEYPYLTVSLSPWSPVAPLCGRCAVQPVMMFRRFVPGGKKITNDLSDSTQKRYVWMALRLQPAHQVSLFAY